MPGAVSAFRSYPNEARRIESTQIRELLFIQTECVIWG